MFQRILKEQTQWEWLFALIFQFNFKFYMLYVSYVYVLNKNERSIQVSKCIVTTYLFSWRWFGSKRVLDLSETMQERVPPIKMTSIASCLLLSSRLFCMVRAADLAPSISLEPPCMAPVPAYILLTSLPLSTHICLNTSSNLYRIDSNVL